VKKVFLITLFTFFVFVQFVEASVERELKIFKNIRCLVCQGQSLNDSNSDFAIDLKKVIKKKIMNNQTDREIYKYLTDRYGDWILFDPPLKMKTILLWILPFLFILMGGALIYKKTVNIKKKE